MSRPFTIGRDKTCDVPIADDSVSRLHAEVWLAEDGALIMADRGSSNGTTLLRGGQSFPLRQDVLLPGDQVRFGSVLLSVADIVQAIEQRSPGSLVRKQGPPPPPPRAPQVVVPPSPPPQQPVSPYATNPYPPGYSPNPYPPNPYPANPPAPAPGGVLVRCECGAVKTAGQICPGCHR